METPKNSKQAPPTRQPTPRLSERKKNLFAAKVSRHNSEDDGLEDMDGIAPLDEIPTRATRRSLLHPQIKSSVLPAKNLKKTNSHDKCDKIDKNILQNDSPRRRSPRLNQQNNQSNIRDMSTIATPRSSRRKTFNASNASKENVPLEKSFSVDEKAEDQLQKLFRSSMRLGSLKTKDEPALVSSKNIVYENMVTDGATNAAVKRPNCSTDSDFIESIPKLARLQSSPDQAFIPAKSFYSSQSRSNTTALPFQRNSGRPQFLNTADSSSMKSKRHSLKQHINRGVRHKVRRPMKPGGGFAGARQATASDVDAILSSIRNEKLRKLIICKRQQKEQIEKVHNILRSSQNPIELARPLSALSHDDSNNNTQTSKEYSSDDFPDFSEIESGSDEPYGTSLGGDDEKEHCDNFSERQSTSRDSEKNSPTTTSGDTSAPAGTTLKRKFFTSGRETNTPKEIKITDHIRATMCNGRISLMKDKQKEKKHKKHALKFTVEQAAVDVILKNLDDTAFGDVSQIETKDIDRSIATSTTTTPTATSTITTAAAIQPLVRSELPEMTLSLLVDGEQSEAGIPTEPETEFDDDIDISSDIQLIEPVEYGHFRNRLPYNTNDKEEIERQHLLLNFLISNNICNEETFNIFIADPDNHKEEAARIVDQVIMVVNEHDEFRRRLPYHTTDPQVIAQQHQFLEYLIQHDICNDENFDIFIANYETRYAEAETIIEDLERCPTPAESDNTESMHLRVETESPYEELPFSDLLEIDDQPIHNCNIPMPIDQEPSMAPEDQKPPVVQEEEKSDFSSENKNPNEGQSKLFPIFNNKNCQPLIQTTTRNFKQRTWTGGYGLDQYQIDAGQKAFGIKQCKQCGLVYSANEPEEERLHRDYHSSMHVLRFKAWIDEDLVAVVPEWGVDGRVIRVTESAHIKRRERLMEILKIVDKELGFSSYIMPNIFVAFLAVRKCQIVGLCLVQPLKMANKYLSVNGVDCCTNEESEAKCGISRIWVSPLHRRIGIASKLFRMVRLNTIHGEEIPVDKIAFSSPTQDGRVFAQKITGLENFLVYQ